MIGKVLAAAAAVSAPAWLPRRVVALRMQIFALVNGQDAVTIPGPQVGAENFKRVYADPAANGRSRGAALSDLFWYWLAPGPQVHQEHLEAGPRYDAVAKCTRHILIRSKKDSEELARRVAAHVLDDVEPGLVRLRDVMMPIWAELYYELVFEEPCPPEARDLIVGHADDVVSALKCVRPRNMRRRARLTKYLRRRLADVPHPLPESLTPEEQAYYLQGTFFNTAVVQMSEAMAHLLMIIAQSPDTQRRLAGHPDDDAYLDRVIDDGLRRFPLFGIAHRIATADIEVADLTIPAGTVLCFSYPGYAAQSGKDDFIPFGVAQNRACPARGLAPPTMRVVTREVLRRFSLASTAAHTRSIPNRGPALLTPRGARRRRAPLVWLAVRDRWEDVWRSLAQLVFGTYMVLDARHQALCSTYFAGGNR
ncbi:cytochrome P450 [Amycolatopsis mediterranei S699]|uniref:Cytochrome P450 n=2 Tax=Amycolatopsis mediterranei TaxID=33910 RepID=A0A0H3CWL8_AMYMU|nr:cytochrome P450 [Amycolatopsis mediterranei]ADJ42713.1 cytochrome P450 [Amycolatopsis mediterranei U32]AEK39404.1 cytochrome P450 [Amycolatopsis mediterranei S699]AFO74427.1 cytochrome P450 [Amycolatopsis mediterranei S699]AGT81556.1 cytochrome P450 [Amycolatopsis mediterranei RB]KDO09987.1 cytochrome P450 [Amycolatopsis mediterranei]